MEPADRCPAGHRCRTTTRWQIRHRLWDQRVPVLDEWHRASEHAAVDRNRLPGNVASLAQSEEADEVSHLFRLTGASPSASASSPSPGSALPNRSNRGACRRAPARTRTAGRGECRRPQICTPAVRQPAHFQSFFPPSGLVAWPRTVAGTSAASGDQTQNVAHRSIERAALRTGTPLRVGATEREAENPADDLRRPLW